MRILEFARTEELFKKHGLKLSRHAFVPGSSPNISARLLAPAEKLGFPVILKLIFRDAISKSGREAVSPAIEEPAAIETAVQGLFKAVRQKKPNAKIQGALIQNYLSAPQVFAAVHQDSRFGAVVFAGALSAAPFIAGEQQGKFRLSYALPAASAAASHAASHAASPASPSPACSFAPLDRKEAEALAAQALFHAGHSGLGPAFLSGLSDFLFRLSKFGADTKAEILCKPVFLFPGHAEAADAKLFEL